MIMPALIALATLAASPEVKPLELTVMSFNIRYGLADDGDNHWNKRRDIVVESIRQYDPDIVGLQECLLFQADYLEEQLRGYRWLGIGRERGGGGEMTAILYKQRELAPIATDNFWLSDTPEVPGSQSWDSSLPRIATYARFFHPDSGHHFHFFNTHFDHRGRQAREESARLLRARARALPAEDIVIITGDFNAYAEDSEPYSLLTGAELFDAWTSAAGRKGPANTWSGFEAPKEDSQRRIDWILFRGPLDCLSAETVLYNQDGRYPSDHYPVVAVFKHED